MSNPLSPNHYKAESGDLEAIDVIEKFGLGYLLGNVLKYILRAGKKDDRLQDLKKALAYLYRAVYGVWPVGIEPKSIEPKMDAKPAPGFLRDALDAFERYKAMDSTLQYGYIPRK